MKNLILICLGKIIFLLIRTFNLGSGSTWPGHIALSFNTKFNKETLKKTTAKTILIAGTNGKTTTGKLIASTLVKNGKTVIHNQAGANLLNGLASSIIRNSDLLGRINKDFLIFESDEFALPEVLENVKPDFLICLNLFRDQLDRYGELDSIANKWKVAINASDAKLILNADDPLMAYLGEERKNVFYFGLTSEKNLNKIKHGADTIYCPKCSSKLSFKEIYFSHLGNWSCSKCGFKRPKLSLTKAPMYPLSGDYNKYNSLAATLLLKKLNFNEEEILNGFKSFKPAFGRQEKIIYKNHEVFIFLSKNPTSFNESLATIKDLGGQNLIFVLNDRIPDGLDVSWIWDIGIERILEKESHIVVSGDRAWDMGLRIKYADFFVHIEEDLKKAIDETINKLSDKEKIYILPNYSAMLEVRKILLGRKLL